MTLSEWLNYTDVDSGITVYLFSENSYCAIASIPSEKLWNYVLETDEININFVSVYSSKIYIEFKDENTDYFKRLYDSEYGKQFVTFYYKFWE